MRIPVDLTQDQIDALARLGEKWGRSRAALIHEAVTQYLEKRQPGQDETFGLWRTSAGEPEDGVDYQRQLRGGWK